jgi:putative nucleotidyltransferase with HDIG domain
MLAMELQRLLRTVNASRMSSIRAVVVGILKIINDPRSTARELVDIIETDPPLAARVLQLVNSAFCAPRQKIADLRQAVIFIGFEPLKELALSQTVCDLFQKPSEIAGYSREAVWRHCVTVAHFAKLIYRREYGLNGSQAYAAGLLHDIGIIVEDQFMHSQFAAALNGLGRHAHDLPAAETSILGYHHGAIGMTLAVDWGFPAELCQGIGYHHEPESAAPEFRQLAATICLANHCAHRIGETYCPPQAVDADDLARRMENLEISANAIDLIAPDVSQALSALAVKGIL